MNVHMVEHAQKISLRGHVHGRLEEFIVLIPSVIGIVVGNDFPLGIADGTFVVFLHARHDDPLELSSRHSHGQYLGPHCDPSSLLPKPPLSRDAPTPPPHHDDCLDSDERNETRNEPQLWHCEIRHKPQPWRCATTMPSSSTISYDIFPPRQQVGVSAS